MITFNANLLLEKDNSSKDQELIAYQTLQLL